MSSRMVFGSRDRTTTNQNAAEELDREADEQFLRSGLMIAAIGQQFSVPHVIGQSLPSGRASEAEQHLLLPQNT